MTPDIRQLPAGNWKMNGTGASLAELMAVSNGDGALVGGASLKAQDFLATARWACAQPAGH